MTETKQEQIPRNVWLVEHPCSAETKQQAKDEGCAVIDIRFKGKLPKHYDVKKEVVKKKSAVKPSTSGAG